jgi:hypothetical protein
MMQKKKYFLLSLFLFLFLFLSNAQDKMGDNATSINSSSLLELQSTNKGFRLPRIVLTDLKTWSPLTGSATSGMVVYNEKGKLPEGLYYWRSDSARWGRVIDSLMVTKVVSNSLTPTELIMPISYYKATTGTTVFPATPAYYTGNGSITYTANEGIRLVYTVKGIKVGYPVSATVSSDFNDNILIGRVKATGDNLVEVFTFNRTEDQVVPENLNMSFSYTLLDSN